MTKHRRTRKGPPKGSYPHPAGGYIHAPKAEPGQRYRIVAHVKAEPDLDKLARAYVMLAKQLAAHDQSQETK